MELLCVLAAVAALFCGCAVLTLKCRVPASVAPLTALSAIVAVLTLAAMAGVLYPAAWLLYLLCLAGGVWVAASCRGSTGAAQRLFIGGGFAAAAEGEAVHLVCASGGGRVNYIAHSVQRTHSNVERVVHMVAHRDGSIAVIALSVHGKVGGDNILLRHVLTQDGGDDALHDFIVSALRFGDGITHSAYADAQRGGIGGKGDVG